MKGRLQLTSLSLFLGVLVGLPGCSQPKASDTTQSSATPSSVTSKETIVQQIPNVEIKRDKNGEITDLDFRKCDNSWVGQADALAAEVKNIRSIRIKDDVEAEMLKLFPSLRNVSLFGPSVTSAGAAHLKDLPELRVVNLNQCSVKDADCEFLGRLQGLKEFGCYGSPIGSEGLKFIAVPEHLTKLNLRGSAITDDGLIEVLPRFYSLSSLEVSETGITDKSIPTIVQMADLVDVNFWLTKITDAGVAQLVDKPLKRLNLDNIPAITNASIQSAAKIKTLEFLHLGKTGITDEGLEPLKSLPNLTELHIGHTAVTQAAADKLKAAMPKVKIVYQPRE